MRGGRTVIREQEFYNLDVIIAVGYRVNSVMATQFRIWATQVLKTYLLKGYAVNTRLVQLEDRVDLRLAFTKLDPTASRGIKKSAFNPTP